MWPMGEARLEKVCLFQIALREATFDEAGAGNVTDGHRTAGHRESDGIPAEAYRARASSRPYLWEPEAGDRPGDPAGTA